VSSDGLIWTLRLRPGLRFHDGDPVLAKDVVASLNRWAAREQMGLMIRSIQDKLTAVDDRTFQWTLRKPYPKMLFALGKGNAPVCFIMPERIAATDPFKQIKEYVGSGPMRFVRDEWVPGAKAVFERFTDYQPRQENASWLAGGKKMMVDRIEWIVMPEPTTAFEALQTGEVDWWELPTADHVPLLQKNRDLMVDIADPLGNVAALRINHLHPPFSDVRARRALLTVLSQEDYMRAIINDDSLWKPMRGYFTPGTPLFNEEGGEILRGPRDFDAGKRLLAESGYAGQPVTLLVAQDVSFVKSWGEITASVLKRLGMNVDYAALDWGTVTARRTQKAPPSQGGWNLYQTWFAGADCATPATHKYLRANGDNASYGWPNSPEIEAEIADWFDAPNLGEEQTIARRLNKSALDHVVYAPTGFYLSHQAWRKNVTGVVNGPLPFFWGVAKVA
jgi:peptide/nickel transport system substrate-binding protein